MKHGPLILFGVFLALALSWSGLVLAPQLQVGGLEPASDIGTGALYPSKRPGLAQQGAEVYRSLGCAHCHSQQVRASETRFEVFQIAPSTNRPEAKLVRPKLLMETGSSEEAEAIKNRIMRDGAEAEIVLRHLGPDIERGWGKRRSVARDYVFDYPVMLGALRIGPDLANIGARQTNSAPFLVHLYNPQISMPGSVMPPYPFLFEKRKDRGQPASEALPLPGSFAPPAGYQVVPKPEAHALVAYLLSLRSDASLFEAPAPELPRIRIPGANTNAPSAGGSATNPPAGK